jgi:hypothetical protein
MDSNWSAVRGSRRPQRDADKFGTGRTLQSQERYRTPVEKNKNGQGSGIKQVSAHILFQFWDNNHRNDSFFVR